MRLPAVLGGPAAFPDGLPLARPALPPREAVFGLLEDAWATGQITNGKLVQRLEEELAARLGVAHAVAVANCTSGLLLVLRELAPGRRVVLPSFTFSATAHAVTWTGGTPVFAECDPARLQIDVDDAATLMDDAGAIVATHVFGAACRPAEVEKLGRAAEVPVVFDAAHALGSTHAGRPLGGYGDAEVFSLSPTKPLVAAEGGLVTTNDDDLARSIRIGRDYGNPGNYDTEFAGLNARMSELHAAVALAGLETLDEHVAERQAIAASYGKEFEAVAGVAVQAVDDGDTSTWKDLTIIVDAAQFGATRDTLLAALRAEGIATRRYFYPPVHRQRAHAASATRALPVTDTAAASVLSLPLFIGMTGDEVGRVVDAVAAVAAHAADVTAAC